MCSRGGDPGPARDNSSCQHSQYLTTDGVIFEASKRLFVNYSMQIDLCIPKRNDEAPPTHTV